MNGTAAIATGINGIRVRPGHLYYTNSAKGTFNVIPINSKTGAKIGKPSIIAEGLLGPDDFEVDLQANSAYLCNGAANEILEISLNTGKNQTIAKIPGPTSARWNQGQIGKTLYISDVGGLAQYVTHNVTVGGAIYRLDL
jgi:sugar lactone lactonase YvrE